VEVLKMEKK